MPRTFDRILILGMGVVVSLLVVDAGVAYRNTRQLHDDALWVTHTNEVLDVLDELFSTAKDAETGQRGFIITGDERYLEPYAQARAALERELTSLRVLVATDSVQREEVPRLQALVQEKVDELEYTLRLRRERGFEVAQAEVLTHLGKRKMDAIRALVVQMGEHERGLLRERSGRFESAYTRTLLGVTLAAFAGLSAVVGFVWILRRQLKARILGEAVLPELRRPIVKRTGWRSVAVDVAVSACIVGAAVLLRWLMDPWLGNTVPFITLFGAVAGAVWYGGLWPGLMATVLGYLACDSMFIEPRGSFMIRHLGDYVGLVLYGITCSLILVLGEGMRRAKRLAQEQLEWFRTTLASIGDAVIATDAEGKVTFLNPVAQELTGWNEADAKGLTLEQVFRIVSEKTREPSENPVARALREGQVVGLANHTVLISKSGTEWPIDDSAAPIRYPDGGIAGVVLVFRDITERKHAEQQNDALLAELEQAARRKDEFLAILAHELRGPLAPLFNTLELVKRAGENAELRAQASATMGRQLKQIVRLVDDLLDVSRIQRNQLELRMERVQLAAALEQALENCRPLAESRKHELSVKLPEQPVWLHGDPLRLAQVFGNLLNNAAKYTEPGGRISLSAEQQGTEVLVRVKDDGIGIPPDMLTRIFEMFVQVDRRLERSHGGLGIGLTLVKQLVELHHGRIEAASDGPGLGSEFTVHLPVLAGTKQLPSATPAAAPLATKGARRILVVDDNVDSAVTLARLLKLGGNETQLAYDGLEALAVAEQFRPDVVLLDIGLPKLSGYDTARRLREQPWGKRVVLVALTGWGKEEDRRQSREAGFDHHLVKPVDFEALLRLLAASAVERGDMAPRS